MKKAKFYLIYLSVLAICFTSCTKDEDQGVTKTEKATLSFGAIVNDLSGKSGTKQSEIGEIPECSDDKPAYVKIILTQGEEEVIGSIAEPFRINLVADQLYTEEIPELELEPETYSLDYFAVFNEGGKLIWIAPKGGDMAKFLDKVLPYQIDLGAGVKKYVDVSVLCYDDRDVTQYGYGFFDFDMTRTFEYCFFANYCNSSGRHFPARYTVDFSIDGEPVISGIMNTTGTNEDGDWYADPLCLHLPNLPQYDDDDAYLDYTVTLLDWEGVYTAEEMIISGSLSRNDIMENFDGDSSIDYEHLRFGCDDSNGELPDELPDSDSAAFSDPTNITNPYYGPPADAIYEYEVYEVENGEWGDEPEEIILIERRTETREVMGITTVIQHDVVYVDGVIVEDTDDWLAQDNVGNIWYMGEYSESFDELGNFLGTEGSWEAGVNEALPGFWLLGNPVVGQIYYQEYLEGEAEDYAEVIALGETVEVNGVMYDNVMITRDVNPFEPEVYELKYYAFGTGLVMEEAYEEGELVEVVILTGIIME